MTRDKIRLCGTPAGEAVMLNTHRTLLCRPEPSPESAESPLTRDEQHKLARYAEKCAEMIRTGQLTDPREIFDHFALLRDALRQD